MDEPRALFVYGTLRPDDDSGAAWTKDFLDGARGQKAVLRDSALFFDAYPCAVLEVSCEDHPRHTRPFILGPGRRVQPHGAVLTITSVRPVAIIRN